MEAKILILENTPTIETQRLILRKFTENDLMSLLELLSDAEVNTFLPWFPLKTKAEAMVFLERDYISYYSKPSAYRYAICLKGDSKPIGYVVLSDNESHDLGYGLKKEFWHRGIATEAATSIIERVGKAGYLYITATHDVKNPHSGEVMKKLGMTYRYTYVEQWQPKDIPVTFRMYQLNFDGDEDRTYMEYWNVRDTHFIEKIV